MSSKPTTDSSFGIAIPYSYASRITPDRCHVVRAHDGRWPLAQYCQFRQRPYPTFHRVIATTIISAGTERPISCIAPSKAARRAIADFRCSAPVTKRVSRIDETCCTSLLKYPTQALAAMFYRSGWRIETGPPPFRGRVLLHFVANLYTVVEWKC